MGYLVEMRRSIVILVCVLMVFVGVMPSTESSTENTTAEDLEAVSWRPLKPVDSVIVVGFDSESLLDDYAYLCGVPASVFYSDEIDQVVSSPLVVPLASSRGADSCSGTASARACFTTSGGGHNPCFFHNSNSRRRFVLPGLAEPAARTLTNADCRASSSLIPAFKLFW